MVARECLVDLMAVNFICPNKAAFLFIVNTSFLDQTADQIINDSAFRNKNIICVLCMRECLTMGLMELILLVW